MSIFSIIAQNLFEIKIFLKKNKKSAKKKEKTKKLGAKISFVFPPRLLEDKPIPQRA